MRRSNPILWEAGEDVKQEPPLLIVVSGPSGVGKDAVLDALGRLGRPFHHVVTVTTRMPREGEKDGRDYHFVSRERFEEMLDKGELLEWAEVYGNGYGVPRGDVKRGLDSGRDVLVKVDVQGAATIKKVVPQAVLIFVAPPTMEDLNERLRQRNSETTVDLERRVETADAEMRQLPLFDYVVVNDEVDRAVARIDAIVTAEKCRTHPSSVAL